MNDDFLTKRWPVLLTALILAYGLLLAMFSRAGFPESMTYGYGMPYLSDRPVGEDAYYMLTVAWNVAEKGRIVYNLDKPTTGIQPLATFLYAGIAWAVQSAGGDRWVLVRAVILFNVGLFAVFAWQIGSIARALVMGREAQDQARALGAVITLSSLWVFRAFTYGLETGLYLVLIASIVLLTLRQDPQANPLKLGLLGGVTGLARIDFGLIFGLLLVWQCKEGRLRLRGAFVAGFIALVITLPWFFWVHALTGHWLPSSAGAQSGWIHLGDARLRVQWMATALLWNLAPWVSSWDMDVRFAWAAMALAALMALALPAVHDALKAGAAQSDLWAARQLAGWSACLGSLVPVYFIAVWAWYFYGRYTAPLLVVGIPALAAVATLAGRRLAWLPRGMLALSPAFFVVLAGLQLHRGRMILDLPINAGFVQHQIDGTRLVGAAQSGVVGFFNANVINLDGKIDGLAQDSMSRGGIRSYIDSQHIDVLVDWPAVYRTFLFAGYTGHEWQLCDRQPPSKSRCYERLPPPPAR